MDKFSPDGNYELRVSSGYIKDGTRVEDGVTLRYDGMIQFENDLREPSNGAVANNGTSAIIQGKNWDKSESDWDETDKFDKLYIFDSVGDLIIQEEFQTPAGIFGCSIDGTGSYVAISGPDEGNVILYDVDMCQVVSSRDYTDIQLVRSIEPVRYDDRWGFKLIDNSQDATIFIDLDGEIIQDIENSPSLEEEKNGDSFEQPITDFLKQQGVSVPDTVFGLVGVPSESIQPNSRNQEHFEFLINQGPIYDPEWSDYLFAVPDPPIVMYVIGPESVSEAANAFDTLERIEEIDLSNWYQVDSGGPTANQGAGELEVAIHPVSDSEPEANEIDIDQGGVKIDSGAALDNLVIKKFFGDTNESLAQPPLNDHEIRYPDNEFGTELYRVLSGESDTYHQSFDGLNRFIQNYEEQEITDVFLYSLQLLKTGEVFDPYSIDSPYNGAFIQRLFDAFARESPETVIECLEELEVCLQNRQSITAPEVVSSLIETFVEEHPERFSSLIPLLDRLLENRSAHPKRRAFDIIATAISGDNAEVAAQLEIVDESLVDTVLKQIELTESAWLMAACCSVLRRYDLTDAEYDTIIQKMDILFKTLQFGGDRRGEEMKRGMEAPSMFATTDQELLDELQSSAPSATALYTLNKKSGRVFRNIARERPESLLPYVDNLIQDLTSKGEGMVMVRKNAYKILKLMVHNLPERQFDTLSEYDSTVLPLAQSEDQNEVMFSFEWIRRSRSRTGIDTLVSIHENNTHRYWQVATAILDDIAPNQVDPTIEPNNVRAEWVSFVKEISDELGYLPKAKEIRGDLQTTSDKGLKHPDKPDTPYRAVFPDGWKEVLDSLEIDTKRRTGGAPIRRRLINELERLHGEFGEPPTTTEIDQYSEFTYNDYRKEFGGIGKAHEVADYSNHT